MKKGKTASAIGKMILAKKGKLIPAGGAKAMPKSLGKGNVGPSKKGSIKK